MGSDLDGIYRPPESELRSSFEARSSQGSVESALAGDFEFDIHETLAEARGLISGSKTAIWGAMIVSFGVSMGIGTLGGLGAQSVSGEVASQLLEFAFSMLSSFLTYPITVGVMLYAVRRAAGEPSVRAADIYACYADAVPIYATLVLQMLLMLLGLAFFILPGIYLAVAYSMAMPLVVDRKMGPWEALETSRKAVHYCWFQLFGLWIVAFLIVFVGSLITFGVGAIWLLPFMSLVTGVVYCKIFGYSRATS